MPAGDTAGSVENSPLLVVLTMLTDTLPQVSLALGASKLHALPHSTVLLPAQVMLGGVVS